MTAAILSIFPSFCASSGPPGCDDIYVINYATARRLVFIFFANRGLIEVILQAQKHLSNPLKNTPVPSWLLIAYDSSKRIKVLGDRVDLVGLYVLFRALWLSRMIETSHPPPPFPPSLDIEK